MDTLNAYPYSDIIIDGYIGGGAMNRAYFIAVALILFNLVAVFTGMLGVFPEGTGANGSKDLTLEGTGSGSFAGVILPTDTTAQYTSIAGALAGIIVGSAAVLVTRSLVPLAVSAFGSVYWMTMWKTLDIFNTLFFTAINDAAVAYFVQFIIGTVLTLVFVGAVIQIASGGWRSHV